MKSIKITEVKIADIVFAFNNAELIQLLRARGGHIMYQRFDEMRKVEQQISTLKNEKFADLTKPVDAFITFEEEDGSIIGQYYEKQANPADRKWPPKSFLGVDLVLVESTEPTNIIWENRHWTAADYMKRTAIVFVVIFFLVLVSFGMIFFCKQFSIKINNKYPMVDCDLTRSTYSSAKEPFRFETYVQKEWEG